MPRISRDTDIYPISLRELEVLRVEDVTVSMRRITFGGPGLLAHTRDGEEVPNLVSDGFDDDIRLILPDPATGERPRPASLGDGRLDWNERVNDLFRTYTVRKWLPDAGEYGELIVDFARHGSGLAENWSAAATAGEHVYIAGPKNCGSHPSHTDWLFLVGDETALPAIARCLEEAPAGHPIIAVVEVPTQADIQQIDCAADLDLRWVVREDGGDFTDEILRLGRDGKRLPSGIPFVWAGGEAGRLKRVRAFAKQAAVPWEHVEITGYWRRNDATAQSTAASSADGQKAAPAGTSSLAPLMQLYEMSEIAPGFALRAAAQLAIFEHIETAAHAVNAQNAPVTEVARRLDIDPSVLLRFLRYLESLDLVSLDVPEVQQDGGQSSADDGADATVDNAQNGFAAAGSTTVSLTSLGRELADPDGPISRLNGPDAMRPLVWLNLVEGLRSAAPVTVGSSGSTWAELRRGDSAISDGLADAEATRAQWVAPALAQEFGALVQRLSGGAAGELDLTSVAVAGAGAGTAAAVYADELLRRHPQLSVTVLDTGAGVDRVRAEVPEARRDRLRVVDWNLASSAGADSATADILIIVDPFALAIPSEVPAFLESASRIAPTVIVISRLLAESGDEDHDYEEDITRMLLDGRSVPTARDMSAAVSAAGLIGVTDLPVGWGTHALVTRRR